MSDFLNRRLGAGGPLTLSGALQSAIDKTTPNINASIKASGATVNASGLGMLTATYVQPVITANLVDGAGAALNSTVGMPGYLMQQDLVQAFSPAMTVRSDTFMIRAYGEVINPATGETQGKAWAEAIVQRLPAFVDTAMPAHTDLSAAPGSPAKTTNQTFGRRFQVVGFRWLSPNDI
jgi:hypothetical protein